MELRARRMDKWEAQMNEKTREDTVPRRSQNGEDGQTRRMEVQMGRTREGPAIKGLKDTP